MIIIDPGFVEPTRVWNIRLDSDKASFSCKKIENCTIEHMIEIARGSWMIYVNNACPQVLDRLKEKGIAARGIDI